MALDITRQLVKGKTAYIPFLASVKFKKKDGTFKFRRTDYFLDRTIKNCAAYKRFLKFKRANAAYERALAQPTTFQERMRLRDALADASNDQPLALCW